MADDSPEQHKRIATCVQALAERFNQLRDAAINVNFAVQDLAFEIDDNRRRSANKIASQLIASAKK